MFFISLRWGEEPCTCTWGGSSPNVLQTGHNASGGVAPDSARPCVRGSLVHRSEGGSTCSRCLLKNLPPWSGPEHEELSPSSSGQGTFQKPGTTTRVMKSEDLPVIRKHNHVSADHQSCQKFINSKPKTMVDCSLCWHSRGGGAVTDHRHAADVSAGRIWISITADFGPCALIIRSLSHVFAPVFGASWSQSVPLSLMPPGRSRGNGSAHFHRNKLQRRAVPAPPHLTQSSADPSQTTSAALQRVSCYHKITCISFFRCSQNNLWEKTLSIYCVEMKQITSIGRSCDFPQTLSYITALLFLTSAAFSWCCCFSALLQYPYYCNLAWECNTLFPCFKVWKYVLIHKEAAVQLKTQQNQRHRAIGYGGTTVGVTSGRLCRGQRVQHTTVSTARRLY